MKNPLPKRVLLLTASLALCACAGLGKTSPFSHTAKNTCAAAPDKTAGMRLALVRQQMEAGRYHAALAYLDEFDDSARARLLRARAQRSTGDAEHARDAYASLLDTCLRAYGEQGLGILAADGGDIGGAVAHLGRARRLAPADPDIRNDYGFALLAAGAVDAALREFQTALELEPGAALAARNLVLALFVARRGDEARAVAGRHALGPEQTAALARRAANYHPFPSNALQPDSLHPGTENPPHAPS